MWLLGCRLIPSCREKRGRAVGRAKLGYWLRCAKMSEKNEYHPRRRRRPPFPHSRCFLTFGARFWVLTNFFWVGVPSDTFTTFHQKKKICMRFVFFVEAHFVASGTQFCLIMRNVHMRHTDHKHQNCLLFFCSIFWFVFLFCVSI